MNKKIISLLVLALSASAGAQIFSSGFEDNNGTPLSEYKKVNADGLTVPDYAPVQDFSTEAWIKYYDGYDNKIAFSTSWYDPAGKSNDWLITPAIQIPSGGQPHMYWKAKSYDEDHPDSYDVMISTTDNQPQSFSTLQTVTGEQPFDYASHTLDLSAYQGKKVYIAFVNKTDDGLYLALDDFYVSNSAGCMMPDTSTAFATNLSENGFTVNWTGTQGITNYDTGLTTFTVPVSSKGVQSANSKDFSGLQSGKRYQFFLKNADCGSGWSTPKSIWTAALLPYSYNFEATEENYGEYDSDGWSSQTWISGIGSIAQNGKGYVFNNTSKTTTKNDWLYSYPIKLQAGETVTIKYFAQMGSAAASPATLQVTAATAQSTASNLQTLNTHTVSGNSWVQYTSAFTASAAGVYYFGFGNVTPAVTTSASLRLDNITFESSLLGTSETSKNTVQVYPNPVLDKLTIKADGKILKTELYSFEGKLIKSGNSSAFDFSSVPKGVYLLKVTTDKGISTHKIIK